MLDKITINWENLDAKVSSVTTKTEKNLFDVSKPVPNELVFWTFAGIFVISVWLAVWIHIYAKKKWYNQKKWEYGEYTEAVENLKVEYAEIEELMEAYNK